MATDRDERYQRAPELAAAAREALTQPVAPAPAPPPAPPPHDVASTVPAPIPPVRSTPPPVQTPRPPLHRTPAPAQPAPPVQTSPPFHSTGPARNIRRRWIIAAALVAVLLVVVGWIAEWALSQRHYYAAEYDGKVTIMRGSQGFGLPSPEAYQVACVNARNELSIVNEDSNPSECSWLTLKDLSPSARQQVRTGLPGGSLDEAKVQLKVLVAAELLPLCASLSAPQPSPTSPTTTASAAPPEPSAPASSAGTPTPAPTATPTMSATSPSTVEPTVQPSPPPKPAVDCRSAH
jgi:hypothetical protein